MATIWLDLRLDEEIKTKAEKASALLGLKSLTHYVVRLMEEDADKVIQFGQRTSVKHAIEKMDHIAWVNTF